METARYHEAANAGSPLKSSDESCTAVGVNAELGHAENVNVVQRGPRHRVLDLLAVELSREDPVTDETEGPRTLVYDPSPPEVRLGLSREAVESHPEFTVAEGAAECGLRRLGIQPQETSRLGHRSEMWKGALDRERPTPKGLALMGKVLLECKPAAASKNKMTDPCLDVGERLRGEVLVETAQELVQQHSALTTRAWR